MPPAATDVDIDESTMKSQDFRDEAWLIALPGAFGGVISWVMSMARVEARLVGLWVDLPLFAVLGAAAGLTFVILLSNTRRDDAIRVVVLSFLAGLAWQPIISGGIGLVSGQEETELGEHVEVFRELQEVVSSREAAQTTDQKAEAEAVASFVLDRVPDAADLRPSIRSTLSALYADLADQLPDTQANAVRDQLARRGFEVREASAGGRRRELFDKAVEEYVPNRLEVPDPSTLETVEALAPARAVAGGSTGAIVHVPIVYGDEHIIDVTSAEADLVAALYDGFGNLVDADDDSGRRSQSPSHGRPGSGSVLSPSVGVYRGDRAKLHRASASLVSCYRTLVLEGSGLCPVVRFTARRGS